MLNVELEKAFNPFFRKSLYPTENESIESAMLVIVLVLTCSCSFRSLPRLKSVPANLPVLPFGFRGWAAAMIPLLISLLKVYIIVHQQGAKRYGTVHGLDAG